MYTKVYRGVLLSLLLALTLLTGCPAPDAPNGSLFFVQYHKNNATSGAAPSTALKKAGVPYTIADNTGNLAITGKMFDGWNDKKDGSGTAYAPGDVYNKDETVILYAQYAVGYTVSYDANGGAGTAPEPQTQAMTKDLTLADKGSLQQTGHFLSGWNSEADGAGDAYELSGLYTKRVSATMYAQWKPIVNYTITYNGNGNTGGTVPPEQIVQGGSDFTVAAQGSLEKTNHRFDGWNSEADGSGVDYAPGSTKTASANITLYAKWIPPITITYSGNGHTGGTPPAAQIVLPGNTYTVAAQGSLERINHRFEGWNSGVYGAGIDYAPGSTKTASANITLYAKWLFLPPYPMANIPGATIPGRAPTPDEIMPYPGPIWKGVFVAGRTVALSTYSVGTHEVSYELWYSVREWAESKGYNFSKKGREGERGWEGDRPTARKNHPVTTVDWKSCVVWCNAYTEYMTGSTADCVSSYDGAIVKYARDATYAVCDLSKKGYRLPTEAEWQYAAQANNLNYASGANKPLGHDNLVLYTGETWVSLRNEASRVAVYKEWWNGTSYVAQNPAVTGTAPCGSKAPTSRGLYDMSGNVFEWCWDWYEQTIPPDTVTNPKGPASGAQRVARGGSWLEYAPKLAVGSRNSFAPDYADEFRHLGFRLCRTQ